MNRILAALGAVFFLVAVPGSTSARPHPSLRPLIRVTDKPACPRTPIHCNAVVVVHSNSFAPYGPSDFHNAYRLPCTPGGPVASVCSTSTFGGQTIGIVDAGDDTSLQSDLSVYDQRYGLPACTATNGCLRTVNEMGGSQLPPSQGWEGEIALDVETAHEICQTCKILLVEADAPSESDLGFAVREAVSLGATEVSNSYGGPDSGGFQQWFDSPGVAYTVSTGDSGYGVESPSTLPNVIATGGTTLRTNTDGSYAGESAWSGGGSGCSDIYPANLWQTTLTNWSLTQCSSFRGSADVSADADPATGAAIYTEGGWYQYGGTSLASPLIAGIIALAGGVVGVQNPQSIPYMRFDPSNSHDVARGSNGSCASIMCAAGAGYDGPTGLGSPNGVNGFKAHDRPTPTPTSTGTATATATPRPPTSTPTPKQTNTPTLTPTATPPPRKHHYTTPLTFWCWEWFRELSQRHV